MNRILHRTLPALLVLALAGCSSSTPDAPAPTAAPEAAAPTVPVADATPALQAALAMGDRRAHAITITSITDCSPTLVCNVAWSEGGTPSSAQVLFGRIGPSQKMHALIRGSVR